MADLNSYPFTARKHAVAFQLSLDQKSLQAAEGLASVGVAAGIDVIEAGTMLILSEGAQRVLPRLKELFPGHPLVADIKCMDGGGFEVGMMFDLGATAATVMAGASDATIRLAVRETASRRGCEVMVDTMGCAGRDGRDVRGQIEAARRARDLGANCVVLHLGYDERTDNRRMVDDSVLLRWAEAVAKERLDVRIQVVGGLTLAQAKALPSMGIRDVVLSMNLGSGPVEDAAYDTITAFTVDLADPADRLRVTNHIRQFIAEVERECA